MKDLWKCQEMIFIQQNLLDCLYHQIYKLIDIDLSRETNTTIHPENQFCRKIGRKLRWNSVFIAEKVQRTILNFSLDSLIITE